jgi:hypothetical protein
VMTHRPAAIEAAAGEAQVQPMLAVVRSALRTSRAVAAGRIRERHPLPDAQGVHAFSNTLDNPASFVSEHGGVWDEFGAFSVRVADAAGLDAHLHFIGARRLDLHVRDLEGSLGAEQDCRSCSCWHESTPGRVGRAIGAAAIHVWQGDSQNAQH